MEQDWDLLALPVDLQKPNAIKKNKPTQSRRRGGVERDPFDDDDDEYFDPQANPFDVNDRRNRRNNRTNQGSGTVRTSRPPSNLLTGSNR